MTSFERECRRARLLLACQHFSDDVDREQHVDGIMRILDGPPYEGHNGYWREHKHPRDQAAEIEELWRFGS